MVPQLGNGLAFSSLAAARRRLQSNFAGQGRLVVAALTCVWALASCSALSLDSWKSGSGKAPSAGHEMLNATLWQQSSAEYVAVANQIYRLARTQLQMALRERDWTAALEQTGSYGDLPAAIMLDLDETVLDNTRYEARIIKRYRQYSVETFNRWCAEAGATAVPGVKKFLDYAQSQGVTIFYYSARKEELRECTLANLKKLGLPLLQERSPLLLDNGKQKGEYRAMAAVHYRILLLIGDSLEDFVDGSKSPPAARNELVKKYLEYWGSKWIVLPNPMYGHWEEIFYDFNYGQSREQRLQKKREALKE
ncbi:MAG: HAD family acid phosphatase [Gammaproteobacteria bacterium]